MSCCGITHSRHCFEINLTNDLAGQIVETGDDDPGGRFAFNCDIATPMRRHDNAVLAVDLFADLLVRADAASYRVCDLDELGQAIRDGLIVPGEARGAARGLAELTAIIERGDLLAFLSRARPVGPLQPPAAVPVGYGPLSRVLLLDMGPGPPGCAAPGCRACLRHRDHHGASRSAARSVGSRTCPRPRS